MVSVADNLSVRSLIEFARILIASAALDAVAISAVNNNVHVESLRGFLGEKCFLL